MILRLVHSLGRTTPAAIVQPIRDPRILFYDTLAGSKFNLLEWIKNKGERLFSFFLLQHRLFFLSPFFFFFFLLLLLLSFSLEKFAEAS